MHMNKIVLLFRKFASYILFISTLFSFIFYDNETLSLIFISLSFLAFIKINFFELFKQKRYLSKLELFFSIVLFVRLFMDINLNIFYKIAFYFIAGFFLIVYFTSYSNQKNISTNILGLKKANELEEDIDDSEYNSDDLKSDTDNSESLDDFVEDDFDDGDDFNSDENNNDSSFDLDETKDDDVGDGIDSELIKQKKPTKNENSEI